MAADLTAEGEDVGSLPNDGELEWEGTMGVGEGDTGCRGGSELGASAEPEVGSDNDESARALAELQRLAQHFHIAVAEIAHCEHDLHHVLKSLQKHHVRQSTPHASVTEHSTEEEDGPSMEVKKAMAIDKACRRVFADAKELTFDEVLTKRRRLLPHIVNRVILGMDASEREALRQTGAIQQVYCELASLASSLPLRLHARVHALPIGDFLGC